MQEVKYHWPWQIAEIKIILLQATSFFSFFYHLSIAITIVIIIIINAFLLQKKLICRLDLAEYSYFILTPGRRHLKTQIWSANVDLNS